ncbi:hypothetical protein ALI144C_30875 [Actinosynnema sp. ALI-1.44]|uniref:PLP-dependent transferase n=1 Tax=Actinosynnema sp. ALI-1.44 TaxID=1933779 RepID=UPI00097C69B9|nr:PLP-dependent transferase [Actinosynnema sp. ALI-1.44]ONI77835.1 hypothetical protein ALI144C_30875 [Actinosynnema sp. ALI-1.44]
MNYPGLAGHPQHELARRQMRGSGGLLSFELHGGRDAAEQLIDKTDVDQHGWHSRQAQRGHSSVS